MLSTTFVDLFYTNLVDAGVYLVFDPKRNQVLDEAASTFPVEKLFRLKMLAATQGPEALGVVFASMADRVQNEESVFEVLRVCIASQIDAVPFAATHATLDGLEVLYKALRGSRYNALEPLARTIIARAEKETDELNGDLLWELAKRILRQNDGLTSIIVESALSRAA